MFHFQYWQNVELIDNHTTININKYGFQNNSANNNNSFSNLFSDYSSNNISSFSPDNNTKYNNDLLIFLLKVHILSNNLLLSRTDNIV
ncbi:MAG TPA: hypothetical protein QKA14_01135 [Candidatus Megaira endosymbiont of Hartmannula sinica]|nr:hypothetical protein [Candidatus Megaera endosymbiont of Hartmannula sinica]